MISCNLKFHPWSHSKHRYVGGGFEAIDKLQQLVISDQHILDGIPHSSRISTEETK